MINPIIDGIASSLNRHFGQDCKIYKEDVPQGFTEPCFSIQHIASEVTERVPPHYFTMNKFDIRFFPKDSLNAKTEMHMTARALFSVLEYIYVLDNLCRGTKMRYEIVDGVLHFILNYDLFIQSADDAPEHYMQSLTTNMEVHNGKS